MHSTSFIVLGVACGIGLALHAAFLRRLRQRHEDTWDSLGRPSLIANNSIENSIKTLRYLFGGHFKELPDPQFKVFCECLRLFDLAYLALFLFVIVFG